MFMIYSIEEKQSVEVNLKHALLIVMVCFVTELLEFCLNEGFADRNLIAKWKKVLSYNALVPYMSLVLKCTLVFSDICKQLFI